MPNGLDPRDLLVLGALSGSGPNLECGQFVEDDAIMDFLLSVGSLEELRTDITAHHDLCGRHVREACARSMFDQLRVDGSAVLRRLASGF